MVIPPLKQQFLNRYWYGIPLLLFFINLVLKLWYVTSRDIAMDEPFTIFHAQADLTDLFSMLKEENNPPLFFLLLHFWIKLFGISPLSVRLLPVIFSSMTAPVIYLLGRKWFSVPAALVAALLFTFSGYHMAFAHEARVYPLFVLLATVSMLMLFTGPKKNLWPTMIGAALVNALLLYSHFFGFIVIATQALMLAFSRALRQDALKRWSWSLLLTLLLYAPYLPWMVHRFTTAAGHGTWVEKPVLSDLYTMVWRYSNAPVVTVFFLLILLTGLIVSIVHPRVNKEPVNRYYAVTWIWFLAPYLSMFLISFALPLFLDRYTIFITPAWYVLIGVSATRLVGTGGWKYLLPAAVVIAMAMTFNPDTDNRRRLKEAVSRIDSLRQPGSAVVICPSWLEYGYTYHHNQVLFKDYHGLRSRLNSESVFPADRLAGIDTNLIGVARSVIYFEEWATLTDKENTIFRYLESRFPHYTEYRVFESYRIHHFRRE